MTTIAFDISQNQIICWLDTLPLNNDAPASPAQDSSTSDLKRQRSIKLDDSRKRQRPISPPKTETRHSTHSDDLMNPSTPSRPSTKRSADDNDPDPTPRADTTSGKGIIRNAPTISSRSDAESHDSKRSRRSQSPTKLPMFGPEGRRLVRDSLTNPTNAHALPSNLRSLIKGLKDVARGRQAIPKRIKTALEKRLDEPDAIDNVYDDMFYDDTKASESEAIIDCAGPEELVRRASRIADRANNCSRMLSDEAAWNNLVHTPLLDMFVSDMRDSPDQHILNFIPCTTTNIDPAYHRFPDSSSRVDYAFCFLPERDSTITTRYTSQQTLPDTAPCLNWTTDRMLQLYPLAFSIETKRHGGNVAKGELQLAIWHAAQWEFLSSRAGLGAVAQLEFIPGVVIQGHIWSLVITTRNQGVTMLLPSIEFGNTDSVVGVFQVIAGLRKLRTWSMDTLWPWYKKHLPGLKDSTIGN